MSILDSLAAFGQGAVEGFSQSAPMIEQLLNFKNRQRSQKIHDDYLKTLTDRMNLRKFLLSPPQESTPTPPRRSSTSSRMAGQERTTTRRPMPSDASPKIRITENKREPGWGIKSPVDIDQTLREILGITPNSLKTILHPPPIVQRPGTHDYRFLDPPSLQ